MITELPLPFIEFRVECHKKRSTFLVTVQPESQPGQADLELEQRQFIEDAIREKIKLIFVQAAP